MSEFALENSVFVSESVANPNKDGQYEVATVGKYLNINLYDHSLRKKHSFSTNLEEIHQPLRDGYVFLLLSTSA